MCAHKTATRVDVTSAQMVIHCFVYYFCRKWYITVWHNLYRWRLGLLLTCDMKCDSEIRHANFCEVKVNISRVIKSSNARGPSILWPCGEPGTRWTTERIFAFFVADDMGIVKQTFLGGICGWTCQTFCYMPITDSISQLIKGVSFVFGRLCSFGHGTRWAI